MSTTRQDSDNMKNIESKETEELQPPGNLRHLYLLQIQLERIRYVKRQRFESFNYLSQTIF